MAYFQFSDFNHCPQGKIAIADIIAILGHQLISLGHRVGWPDEQTDFIPETIGVNVVLESFADPADTLDIIAAAHARGCRFGYVATEIPTERGFNYGATYGMVARQEIFPRAARYADWILHLVPGDDVTRWYNNYAPAAHAELGFAEPMVHRGEDVEPTHDFGFYGQMTPRRQITLDRLKEHGSLILEDRLLLPRAERDALMRQAKVIVHVRDNDDSAFVSSTRCVTALCMGRPVVSEPYPVPTPWDDVVMMPRDMDEFYYAALGATQSWRLLRDRQLAALAARFSPERCIGRALREIGIV